uniref:Glutaredoxin and cysteine rich domain containing 2 n=1 Tax=Molossus molossus TaxID=27622 RepID=A0A7J8I6K9_MOLMO|nr:glutaredoxin and cysteine rich domain containing 2 [Molossus molossus]
MDKRDFMRKILQKEGEVEEESLMTKEEIYGDSDQNNGPLAETESTFPHNQYPQLLYSERQALSLPFHRKGSFQMTTVFTAEGRAVPPALCATAASSRCWPTDLRSPIGPCGALPAMRMACSLARFAINSPWL